MIAATKSPDYELFQADWKNRERMIKVLLYKDIPADIAQD